MGKKKAKKTTPTGDKIINGLAKYAKKNFDIPQEVAESQVQSELRNNKEFFEEIAQDFYGTTEFKEKMDYDTWKQNQFALYGNPFASKKKDTSVGSEGSSDIVGTGVSEGQNPSEVKGGLAQAAGKGISNAITSKGGTEKEEEAPLMESDLFIGGDPTKKLDDSELLQEDNLSYNEYNKLVEEAKANKPFVEGSESTEQAASYGQGSGMQSVKSDIDSQANYFLAHTRGFDVDMSLNTDMDSPQSETEQIYTKLIAQDNQFMRDSGRGSNMDYIKSKTAAGDYSSKDQFKRYQRAYATRMNALNAKVQSLSQDPEVAEAQKLYESGGVVSNQKYLDYIEAIRQIQQLQKLKNDKDFIKNQFGGEVAKEHLEDIAAQKKADIDYIIGKNTPFMGLAKSEEAKNFTKQIGNAAADFLTGVVSLARIPGSPSEYGWGDKVADWANDLNDDFKATFPEPTQLKQSLIRTAVDSKGNVIKDENGETSTEINWEVLPYKATRGIADLAILIGGTKGLGSVGVGSRTGMFAMGFSQSYNQSFQEALAKGVSREQAESFALTNASSTAMLELIAPNSWALKGAGYSDNLFASMAKEGFKKGSWRPAIKGFLEGVKETTAEGIEEGSQTFASEMIGTAMEIEQYRQAQETDQTFGQKMMESVMMGVLIGSPMGVGAGRTRYSELNNLTKAAAFEIAINPEFTREKLKEQFELQNIPANKQNEILQQLDDIKEIHESLPDEMRRGSYQKNIIDLSLQREELVRQSRSTKLPEIVKEKIDTQIQEIDARLEEVVRRNASLSIPMQLQEGNPEAVRKGRIVEATKEKAQLQEELGNPEITEERQAEIETRITELDESIKGLTGGIVESEGKAQQEPTMLEEARFTKAQRRSKEAPTDNTVIESEGKAERLQVQERNPLTEQEIIELETQKKELETKFADKKTTVDEQIEISEQIEAINKQLDPQYEGKQKQQAEQFLNFGNNPREIKINIAAATKRALDTRNESAVWKGLQDTYRSNRDTLNALVAKNAPAEKIKEQQDILDAHQERMHKEGQELIISEFERETGLKVKAIENSVGRFDDDVEPSHVITFEVKNNEEFAKVDEAARKFSEKTLQDAYIITQDINDSDKQLIETQLGKPLGEVLVHEDIDFGERGTGKIVQSRKLLFDRPFSQEEILQIEKELGKLKLNEFTIADDGKSIEFQLFSFKNTPDEVITDISNQIKSIGEFAKTVSNDYQRIKQTARRSSISFYRAADQILEGESKKPERDYNIGRGNRAAKTASQPSQSTVSQKKQKQVSQTPKSTSSTKKRQKPLESEGKVVYGENTELLFSADQKPVAARFAVVEADNLQASNTITGKENPLHAISAAQPKAWDDLRETRSNDIRDNPRMNDLSGKSTDPYNGTPIANERGEIIQGNNRTVGLQKHYDKFDKDSAYKQFLIENAESYGLSPKDIEAMQAPVLVRIADVSDSDATTLGQSLAADRESGGEGGIPITNAINAINADKGTNANPVPASEKIANLMNEEGNEGKSIRQLLMQNDFGKGLLDIFLRAKGITTQIRNTLIDDGKLTQDAKDQIEKVLAGIAIGRGIVGQDASVSSKEVSKKLNTMPLPVQEAINESTRELLQVEKPLGLTLYNAFRVYNEFTNGIQEKKYGTFDDFASQRTIEGSPIDKYGKDAINLARFFYENRGKDKTLREGFKQFLSDYTANIKGDPDNLFNPIPAMKQQDAAIAASQKLLENNRPQPENKTTRERESRGGGRNTSTQRRAAEAMAEKLSKAFPNAKVSFDENLTNKNGEAISAVFRDGEIILNPKEMTMEDVLEEHAHFYLQIAQAMNPTLLAEGKRVIDNSKEGQEILAEVERDYPDYSTEAKYNEAIAKAIARYGINPKKPSRFTRFVTKMRDVVRFGLRKISPKFYDKWIKTTKTLDVGKMSLSDFSQAMSRDMLSETPLTYVSSSQLAAHINSKQNDKVEDITVERGLLQNPTRLDGLINRAKYWLRTDAGQSKSVMNSARTKAARMEASSKNVANNTYLFAKEVQEAANKEFEKSDLKGKELKAAKSAFKTQLYQDANEVLGGRVPSQPLPEGLQNIVGQMRKDIDDYTKRLIEAGIVPNDDLVGQFNEELSIFIRRNFDIEQKIQSDVRNGYITQEQANQKLKDITASSVTTKKEKKGNTNDVDITITMQDGTTHDFTGLDSKDIYYLFGKEKGKEIMNKKGNINVEGTKLYSNPLYAVMMANIGQYVNRSYAIHSTKDIEDYYNNVDEKVMQKAEKYFAERLRNPKISAIKVEKMPNGRFSLVFQNKYGRKTDSDQFNNLTKEEALAYLDGEDNKAARHKLDKALSNPQYKKNFEVQMRKYAISDKVNFPAAQSDIVAEVKQFLRNQNNKATGDGRTVSPPTAKKKTGVTKKRKTEEELPKVLRDLMGENTDPLTNYENTMMKMANLLHTQEMINKLWQEGGEAMFSDSPTPTNSSKRISAEGNNAFAPLDGKYTSPEIYELLFASSDPKSNSTLDKAYTAWLYMNGLAKVNLTVRSMGSNVRNTWGAFKMLASSGMLNPRDLPEAIKIVYENTRPGKYRDFYNRGVELGVFSQNIDSKIIKAQLERAKLASKKKVKDKRGMWDNLKTLSEKVYQFPDDLAKAMAMLSEMRYQKKAAAHEGKTLTDDEAMVAAAENVRASLPNYALTSKGMQALSKNALFGSFVMFQAETNRNRFNTAAIGWNEFRSDNPVRKKKGVMRLASMAATFSIAPALALMGKMAIGMEDEEEEGVRAMMREYEKNNVLLWTGRNSKGEPTYLDLSYIDPDTQFHKIIAAAWRGKGFENSFTDAIKEMYTPFIGMEIFTSDAFKVIDNEDDFGRGVVPKESKEWGVMKATTTAGANLVPKITYEMLYMAMGTANEFKGDDDAKYQTYTRDIKASEEFANNLLGTKARSFDAQKRFKGVVYSLRNAKTFGDDLLRDKSSLIRNMATTLGIVGELTKERKMEIAKANYKKAATQIHTAIKTMRKYGYKDSDIRSLTKGVVSNKIINAILRGDLGYHPFEEDKVGY